jgi:nucleotide-binding universal stress UspA family protein
MYGRILVGLDGSPQSNHAMHSSLEIAKAMGAGLVGCHVYAAAMHRSRFAEMEIGLPQRYQSHEKLSYLRDTHEDIISGGMKMISDAYLAPLQARASEMGVEVSGSTPEGRNYARFLEVLRSASADLVVLGAEGLGKVPESGLGSFAERMLLLGGSADLLIARGPWRLKGRPVVVGVDGSEDSYLALRRAGEMARLFGGWVEAVAVYDPFFHTGVFGAISEALTKEQASRFNFAAQERLHDEIIDDGLRSLYADRVEQGISRCADLGVRMDKVILAGKVFPQIMHHASARNAGLVVVGRYGIHREPMSLIGSNAHALARLSSTNLLVVASAPEPKVAPLSTEPAPANADPAGTRTDAREGARVDHSTEPSKPGDKGTVFTASAEKEAELVVMKKAKRMAPGFHEHIVRSKIVGASLEKGQRFLVYDIVETSPDGKVKVTPRTKLEFV